LLGRFENFPEIYHGIVQLRHQSPSKKLQEIILQALHNLTREDGFVFPSIQAVSDCKVNFDFGIADGATFNYLKGEMLNASLETVLKDALPVLDFICVVRYYRKDGRGCYKPLKFDYYLLRFLFHDENVDFQIFHERGTRRLSIEDLSTTIINMVDEGLSENGLPKITVEYARTL